MFTPHHVSHVRCQMSGVRCHVSGVTCFFVFFFFFSSSFLDKVVKLVGGGSVINGALPVLFILIGSKTCKCNHNTNLEFSVEQAFFNMFWIICGSPRTLEIIRRLNPNSSISQPDRFCPQNYLYSI